MTGRFFDTVALVKRYAEEPGTDTVDELIDDADATVLSPHCQSSR